MLSQGDELELVGAVYCVGAPSGGPAGGGRYIALSRGPDGFFWIFDQEQVRRVRMAVSEVLPRCVSLLVYARVAAAWDGGGQMAAAQRRQRRRARLEGTPAAPCRLGRRPSPGPGPERQPRCPGYPAGTVVRANARLLRRLVPLALNTT